MRLWGYFVVVQKQLLLLDAAFFLCGSWALLISYVLLFIRLLIYFILSFLSGLLPLRNPDVISYNV